MAQIFHRSFNTISRLTIFGAVFLIVFLGWALLVLARSSYVTNAGIARDQPVPFSHQHHVADLGIDCRYCHEGVTKSSFAGMPPTKTCMNCHQQIWVGSEMLEPVRKAYKEDKPIRWERVHRLADFVYFNHSIHVNNGIGCNSCHGQVEQMPLMYQHGTLLMEWCLNCHRQPDQFVRPRDEVFNMEYVPDADKPNQGKELADQYGLRKLTHCSTCHR
jgi:hypothetical protein